MGIYENELACGCRAMSTTYSETPDTFLTHTCPLHTPEPGKVITYNILDFRRRYSLVQNTRKDARSIRVLEMKSWGSRQLFRFEFVDAFSCFDFRNPIYFSEFDGAPSFVLRPDGVVEGIDIFHLQHLHVPGL
jgi:hypothetical protein